MVAKLARNLLYMCPHDMRCADAPISLLVLKQWAVGSLGKYLVLVFHFYLHAGMEHCFRKERGFLLVFTVSCDHDQGVIEARDGKSLEAEGRVKPTVFRSFKCIKSTMLFGA